MKLLLETLDTYLGADWLDKPKHPDQTARLMDQLYFKVGADDIPDIIEN
jgi:hypothetical protein